MDKERQEAFRKMEHYINILKYKKQIILQGAPGTGKTYISAAIAMKLIDGKEYGNRKALMDAYKEKIKDGQIAFTTFHQSLDYEEFVEGFKPVGMEEGEMIYEVKDGIFKMICNPVHPAVHRFIDYIKSEIEKNNGFLEIHKGQYPDSKTGIVNIDSEKCYFIKQYLKGERQYFFNLKDIWNAYQDLKNKEYIEPVYIFYFIKLFADFLEKQKKSNANFLEKQKNKKYILIIDEINRGNISKILGELITLLESDKRAGEKNEIQVTLPYSNEKFSIPDNLYIIATMNTADRSIGHIDYAVRRRFAFITLLADENKIQNENGKALFRKVKAIFNKENINSELKADDLMVGHSYFMAKDKEKLEINLEYEIKPLLLEYVKDGVLVGENLEETIKDLKV